MALRIPRGFERNVPNYQELCEGVRPVDTAAPRTAYTGLPHVRIDQNNYDPIVIDAGTIVGRVSWTGAAAGLLGTIVPAILPTGLNNTTGANNTVINFSPVSGASSVKMGIKGTSDANTDWGLPGGTAASLTTGPVKPIGVVYQPIYTFLFNSSLTNYVRNVNLGVVTDYVVMVPAVNAEEHAIQDGDVVMLGSGNLVGAGWGSDYDYPKAGRYAKYNSNWAYANERVVGRCLKKIRIATTSSTTAGTKLSADIANVTLTTEASTEFGSLDKVQTVPGLSLQGSGTKGIPSKLLDATLDDGSNYPSTKCYWALVLLIRL